MNVLIDTSVLSLALRRQAKDLSITERSLIHESAELIDEGRMRIIGLVRQELLSGIRTPEQYERLRNRLRAFADDPLETDDYERAAKASNECRSRGITVSPVDILLCAVAVRRKWGIFTTDPDFERYAEILPITLHIPRKG